MKKFIIISLIAISFSTAGAFAAEAGMFGAFDAMGGYDMFPENAFPEATLIKEKKEKFVPEEQQIDMQEGLFNGDETVQSVIYNSVMTQDPRTMHMGGIPKNKVYDSKNIPVFKRTRIKLFNWLRNKEHESYLKDLEKEKKQLEQFEKDLEKEKLINDIFYTSKEEKEAAEKSLETPAVEDVKIEDPQAGQGTQDVSEASKPVKLKGKLKQNKGENLVVLDAKNIYYVEENDEIIAENDAVVKFPKQKITMKADKFVYINAANIVKAIGNVRINHSGREIFCDYVQVNVNEEEISFENMNAEFTGTSVKAENGVSRNNTLYLYNGYLSSDGNKRIGLPSRKLKGFRPDDLMPISEDDKFFIQPYLSKDDTVHFDTGRIIINAKQDHDVITLKDTKVHYGNNKVFRIPSLTAYMDKQHKSFEANYPEFGSIARLGMFIGPGIVLEVPRAGTLKFIPFLNYRKDELGVGGSLRYHGANNITELSYGSVSDIFVMKGHQQLDDKLSLEYGMNYFFDQWFLGGMMPKYALELLYKDSYRIPSTFRKGLDMTYQHRASFGYYHNSMYNMYAERFKSGNIGTFRGRYMAQIEQDLYKHMDEENFKTFKLSALMQGSAALYGTGDTQIIGRMGLRAHSQYKYWMQDISYFLTAWDDNTPMQRFDAYRYGTSSLQIREALKLCKFLSVAWSGVMSLSDDASNQKLFQENAFLIILGPEDFKLTFGYDFLRKRTYVTVGFSLNTTGATLKYKTLEIKNPDKLSGDEGEQLVELQPEFWLIPHEKNVKAKPLQYAQVINISEDDNRERID